MALNKPNSLPQEKISELIAENTKLVNSYYIECQNNKNSEYLPSSYFKTLNGLEHNLLKILGNIDPNEFLDNRTTQEALEFYSKLKINF